MKKDKDLENNPEFEEYRRKMHTSMSRPDEGDVEEESGVRRSRGAIYVIFGIFMVLVYIGMGVLLILNFFGAPPTLLWTIANYTVGVILIIYGVWRAIRLIFGLDTRL